MTAVKPGDQLGRGRGCCDVQGLVEEVRGDRGDPLGQEVITEALAGDSANIIALGFGAGLYRQLGVAEIDRRAIPSEPRRQVDAVQVEISQLGRPVERLFGLFGAELAAAEHRPRLSVDRTVEWMARGG